MLVLAPIRRTLGKIAPWVITIVSLYYAFRGITWPTLFNHIGEARPVWLVAAVLLTCLSYLFRSWRWMSLFPETVFRFINAAQVLVLGFFMNNILPARAGEFVRAHMGARLSGQSRTLVLATIASERLVDGLTISAMFVLFAVGVGDESISHNLMYVAYLFAAAAVVVIALIGLRQRVFGLAARLNERINHRASQYTFDRIQIFVNGLTPLSTPSKLPTIIFWSAVIWGVELLVYKAVSLSFGASLSWPECVLFLVAVNFASLIPAAPAGAGVIEFVASAVLVSLGIPRELALTMVIAQHLIQFCVVGIPGLAIMLMWKRIIAQLHNDES